VRRAAHPAHVRGAKRALPVEPALDVVGDHDVEAVEHLEIGDGANGLPAGLSGSGPFDIIVLTGSVPQLPRTLLASLAAGGRAFAVIGDEPIMAASIISCAADGALRPVELFETLLAPLANCEQPSRFTF